MIIGNINHIKDHTDVSISVNIASFKPLVLPIARQYIFPLLPKALFNRINDLPEPGQNDNSVDAQLLFHFRECMANLISAAYVPRGTVSLEANGLRRKEGTNEKTAYRYQETAFVRSYRLAGLSVLDELLQYCQEHQELIPEWKNSQEAKRFETLLIKNGLEFSNYINLKYPQITFRQLLPDMENVERIIFQKNFGDNYFILKGRLKQLNTQEVELVEDLKRYLSNAALQSAIPRLSISIEEDGITSIALDDQQDKSVNKTDNSAIELLSQSLAATANEYLALAREKFSKIINDDTENIYNKVIPPISANFIDNSQNRTSFAM